LPWPSFVDSSHTACREPTSDQPQATGTIAALEIFSITAQSIEMAFAEPKTPASSLTKAEIASGLHDRIGDSLHTLRVDIAVFIEQDG
jgi:hypothetical protein